MTCQIQVFCYRSFETQINTVKHLKYCVTSSSEYISLAISVLEKASHLLMMVCAGLGHDGGRQRSREGRRQ